MSDLRITVIGSGAWGTALAVHFAGRGFAVRQWLREPEVLDQVRRHRENRRFFPGVAIPDAVEVCGSLDQAVDGADLALAVVPSPYARGVYRELAPVLAAETPLVVANKGIEEESLALPLEVVADELGGERRAAVLSGPSFAREVAAGHATAVVIASTDAALAERLQRDLSSAALRLYTNEDPIGVQLAGALKNVVAISAGITDGLGMGHNARAAVITRGLAEISRLGMTMGGRASTFSGLAGLGDLVLTCTGDLSRNRQVGLRLGRGESLEQILQKSRGFAEGVRTARSARLLAQRHDVPMPLVEEVHRILFEQGRSEESLQRLMGRPLTTEEERRVGNDVA